MKRNIWLLIGVLLALMMALVGGAAAEPVAPVGSESEPNDTQATADAVALGQTSAAISPVGDVDYFKLSLNAGQKVYLAALADCGEWDLETTLAVYDAAGNLLAQAEEWPDDNIIFGFVPPASADYFVRVMSDGYPYSPEELTGNYTLWAVLVPADEPNESVAPVEWGDAFTSTIFAPYDLDYYRIHARPGDVIAATMTVDAVRYYGSSLYINNIDDIYPYFALNTIYAPGTARITFVVPFESDYVIRPVPTFDQCDGLPFPFSYDLTVERLALHVGAAAAGNVNGVSFGTNDIMARDDAGQWRKVFDGEDVGLTTAIQGFEWTSDGALLLALMGNQTLNGPGLVKPQDIVKFTPTQLGDNTQGTFSFYLRGTQAGLTTVGEKIDAIALLGDGGLLISTTGSATVPQLGGGSLGARDEDLLLYHPDGPMPSTGTWTINMDGSRYLSKFGSLDLRVATIAADYPDPDYEPFYHHTWLWFANDKPYKYEGFTANGYKRYTAAPGDLIFMNYYEATYHGPQGDPEWAPLTRQTLGFPKRITNVSIGE
ncbi:MAG TPA: hypothetical protein PK205_11950 [Promineifilum sp.]|nr:hypothetical protein [Promineifilum sp.]HRQ14010.1 hypothetical protein [Promineifilum sp.]